MAARELNVTPALRAGRQKPSKKLGVQLLRPVLLPEWIAISDTENLTHRAMGDWTPTTRYRARSATPLEPCRQRTDATTREGSRCLRDRSDLWPEVLQLLKAFAREDPNCVRGKNGKPSDRTTEVRLRPLRRAMGLKSHSGTISATIPLLEAPHAGATIDEFLASHAFKCRQPGPESTLTMAP